MEQWNNGTMEQWKALICNPDIITRFKNHRQGYIGTTRMID
jgi:hypothetical protein